jgi:hypothetical protein
VTKDAIEQQDQVSSSKGQCRGERCRKSVQGVELCCPSTARQVYFIAANSASRDGEAVALASGDPTIAWQGLVAGMASRQLLCGSDSLTHIDALAGSVTSEERQKCESHITAIEDVVSAASPDSVE